MYNEKNVKEYRKIAEKEFHNKLRSCEQDLHVMGTRWTPEMEDTIKHHSLWVNMKYYSIERKSRAMVLQWFKENCPGKRVLDYCCGNGEDGRIIAKYGAKEVVGIDISETSIANCAELAKEDDLEGTITYLQCDAENTMFEDNSFDIITEYGALHHLDLKKAYAELTRILRPNGKIICNEALGHNPFIHLYRKLTPHLRTAWEVDHIMRKQDFLLAHKYFGKIEIKLFHLFTLLAVPFRKTPLFFPFLTLLEHVDSFFLKLHGLKWWAWQTVFVLSDPQK
jgi:ubiquinone/menaquinone biosynthesis C-methylase UbiE